MSDIFNFGIPENRSFMRNYTRSMFTIVMVVSVFLMTSCSTEDNSGTTPAPEPTVLDIVNQNPNLSTLRTALNRANLTSALQGPNITLFAPDNSAFAAAGIDVNTIAIPTLQAVLGYHVLGRRVSNAGIPFSDTLKTLNLANIYASANPNGRFINGLPIRQADLQGSNGYVHIMGNVLTPPSLNKTIASVIANDTTFSFLLVAVTKANLLAFFNNPNKLTVFAPTNAAFRAVGITDINAVPVSALDPILKHHVHPTNRFISDFINNNQISTVRGLNLVETSNPPSGIYTVKLFQSANAPSQIANGNRDIVCSNGVIHVINRAILL